MRSKRFIAHVLELGVEIALAFPDERDGTGDVLGVFERAERRGDRERVLVEPPDPEASEPFQKIRMANPVPDTDSAETVSFRECPCHEDVFFFLRERDRRRIVGDLHEMNVRFVYTNDDIFGHRVDELPELGGIEKLPCRIVWVARW